MKFPSLMVFDRRICKIARRGYFCTSPPTAATGWKPNCGK